MTAFVINLDKNPERLAFMREQFKRLGMEVERFPAVYGKAMTAEDLRRDFARVRSYIAVQRKLEPSQVACSLSHANVYKEIIDRNLPYALILEDDVKLGNGFLEALDRVEKALDPARPQVFSFNGYGVTGTDDCPPAIRPEKKMWCADAYVITRPAAERIRHANYPVLVVADAFKRFSRRFGVELYRAVPTTARQMDDQFPTENVVSPKLPWYLRLPLRVLDWMLWKLTGR